MFIKKYVFLILLDPEDGGIILLRQVAFYQLKQCYIPEDLNQELQIFSLGLFHTPFIYPLRLVHAHCIAHYRFIYTCGSLLLAISTKFVVVNKRWQQSLQEPDVDVVPHVTTRCHYSAEPPALHVQLTVPQS
jgi:hypothetical protein